MAVERIHRTVYPWGTGPIGASGYASFTKTEVDETLLDTV